MSSNDAPRGTPDPSLFEKKRPDTPQKRPGSRIPVGVYLVLALAVIVIVGVVLYFAASHTSTGGNGHTTSGIVVLASVVPTLLG